MNIEIVQFKKYYYHKTSIIYEIKRIEIILNSINVPAYNYKPKQQQQKLKNLGTQLHSADVDVPMEDMGGKRTRGPDRLWDGMTISRRLCIGRTGGKWGTWIVSIGPARNIHYKFNILCFPVHAINSRWYTMLSLIDCFPQRQTILNANYCRRRRVAPSSRHLR